MILFRSLANIFVALTMISVIVPGMSAQAITRIGNSRTTIKVNNNKLAESRVGNGRPIDRKNQATRYQVIYRNPV